MISHFINEPDHWRARAEEARNLAHQMNDPESKDAMLRIADDYESVLLTGPNTEPRGVYQIGRPRGAIHEHRNDSIARHSDIRLWFFAELVARDALK
jgi:hypothetical protein